MQTIFPDHHKIWHLSTIFEKTIKEKESERPLPHEIMELSKKILSVIEAGFPPIEIVGKHCPVCGFGELGGSFSGQAWGHAPPANTIFLQCNHCGFTLHRINLHTTTAWNEEGLVLAGNFRLAIVL